MIAPELKPCPFCWNEKIEDWGESTWSRPVKWMYCTECSAQGPRIMLERNEEGDAWLHRAITAWNTRADLAPPPAKVKALVWVELARGLFGATTPFGCYHVWEGHYQAPCDKMGQPALDPRSEAQADYEARILAALEGGDG